MTDLSSPKNSDNQHTQNKNLNQEKPRPLNYVEREMLWDLDHFEEDYQQHLRDLYVDWVYARHTKENSEYAQALDYIFCKRKVCRSNGSLFAEIIGQELYIEYNKYIHERFGDTIIQADIDAIVRVVKEFDKFRSDEGYHRVHFEENIPSSSEWLLKVLANTKHLPVGEPAFLIESADIYIEGEHNTVWLLLEGIKEPIFMFHMNNTPIIEQMLRLSPFVTARHKAFWNSWSVTMNNMEDKSFFFTSSNAINNWFKRPLSNSNLVAPLKNSLV